MAKEQKQRSSLAKWTRRSFLASAGLVGGGLVLGLTLSPNRLKIFSPEAVSGDEVLLNTWVKVTPDNKITVLIPHSEMGQGSGTGLAQMLAEELEADWAQVLIEQAPATDEYANSDLGRGYTIGEGAMIPAMMYPMIDFAFLKIAAEKIGQLTGGSTAIRATGQYGMRRAGAAAKEMLLKAAAEKWQVSLSSLTVEKGVVRQAGTRRSATFGELATKAATFEPSLKPALKDPQKYTIVGQPKPRLDIPEKVNGSAGFGIDVVVPNMRYAAIMMAPIRDAKATTIDDKAALARSGVEKVINIGDTVSVIADSYWTATVALQDLDITWEGGLKTLSSAGIRTTQETDLANKDLDLMTDDGDVTTLLKTAASKGNLVISDYDVPYLAHATMEPMNCTAWVRSGICDIWVGHQNALFARRSAAEVLGIAPEKVTIHNQYLGGGFGRRSRMDFVTSAVRIAKEAKVPVKIIWSREEDIANDSYRPAVISKMRGVVDGKKISALAHHFIDPLTGMPDSEGAALIPYDIANKQIGRVKCPPPIRIGSWRAVDHTQMGFFVESFIDELAFAAKADPLDFRLAHTSDPRRRAVLEKLKTASKWNSPLGERRARGIAIVFSFGTIVGQVVEASVSKDGGIKLHHVTSVVDCGQVINPNAAEAQIQGSVIYGLTSALFGEITLEGGAIQQKNFPDYNMLKLANAPDQTVIFMQNDHAPGGLGEPGVPPVTPALTNALFAAIGKRFRSLPLSKAGLYVQ